MNNVISLVGHGRSEGDRGYILDIQSYATDVIAYIEDMKAKYPSVPMFLMGHSMVSSLHYFSLLILS